MPVNIWRRKCSADIYSWPRHTTTKHCAKYHAFLCIILTDDTIAPSSDLLAVSFFFTFSQHALVCFLPPSPKLLQWSDLSMSPAYTHAQPCLYNSVRLKPKFLRMVPTRLPSTTSSYHIQHSCMGLKRGTCRTAVMTHCFVVFLRELCSEIFCDLFTIFLCIVVCVYMYVQHTLTHIHT